MYIIWWMGHYNHAWVPPYSRPTLQVSPTVVQSKKNVCFHIFRKALFIPVHTSMYQCCISTYSPRSHSTLHFHSGTITLATLTSLLPTLVWRFAGRILPLWSLLDCPKSPQTVSKTGYVPVHTKYISVWLSMYWHVPIICIIWMQVLTLGLKEWKRLFGRLKG